MKPTLASLLTGALLLLFLGSSNGYGQARERSFEYEIDGEKYEALVVRPDRTDGEKLPGVLVVHDWTGPNAFARAQAEKLAALGSVGFAVDLYGVGKRAANPEEAKELSAPFYENRELFRARMRAALEELKKEKGVDLARLGAIGFCFGGTAVLELARTGADVKGSVSFHGGLKPGADSGAGKVTGRILVLHGVRDPHVPPADLAALMEELNAAQVYYKVVGYPMAVHAFTNPEAGDDPSKGAAYNPEAANDAFSEMKRFFAELFTPPVSLPPDTAMR